MTTQSLSDHLAAAYEAPEDDDGRAAFRVNSPDAAEWACRKLAQVQQQIADADSQAATEIRRINDWREHEQRHLAPARDFFESLLIDWHRRLCDAELAEAGSWDKVRHKTRRLPSGEVSARLAPDSWAATDEPAFIAWAKTEWPGLVKTKESANIAQAKTVLRAESTTAIDPLTGELVPGITVTPGEVHYSVKVEP